MEHSHIVTDPCSELPVAMLRLASLQSWEEDFEKDQSTHYVSNLLLDRVLKLIKSTSGRFQDFMQHSDSLQTCHFSPSGTLLFTVAHNEILLWEVQGL